MNQSTKDALVKSKTRNRECPVVLIVGPTGSGKSRSVLNMPPEQTAIINCEGKPLSFIGNDRFPYVFTPVSQAACIKADVETVLKEPDFKYIFIDSFTQYCRYLYDLCKTTKVGWEVQNMFNDTVFEFIEMLKASNKIIFMTAIDEIVQIAQTTGGLQSQRRVAITGKKWEGQIETQFTYVLFTKVTKDGDKMKYSFVTNTDGTISAKTPENMFKSEIANDCWEVTRIMEEKLKLNKSIADTATIKK